MKSILYYIQTYGKEFLVMDGRVPSISNSSFKDELRLYDLGDDKLEKIAEFFLNITGKTLNKTTNINTLSGGQKIILSALMALESKAQNLMFVNFFQALYPSKKQEMMGLIDSYRPMKTQIKVLENS